MQVNIALLAKKAIDSALKGEWQAAIQNNRDILLKEPNNIDAKLRLGRAYIQVKQFKDAQKLFEEVLKIDPINQIAIKNLKVAIEKRVDNNGTSGINAKSLIKEPGTTTETDVFISASNMTHENFAMGEVLKLKIKKTSVDVIKQNPRSEITVGTITDKDIVARLNMAQSKKSVLLTSFIRGEGKKIKVLIKSDIPVFKAERQEVKPYIKKGSIEEPELEIEAEAGMEA